MNEIIETLNAGLRKCKENFEEGGYIWDYVLPIGCVVCTNGVLVTHTVPGYGDICNFCVPIYKEKAVPYPWSEEFTIINKAGFNLGD